VVRNSLNAAGLFVGLAASAVAQVPSDGAAVWTAFEAHGNVANPMRFTLLAGLKEGGDYAYEQWRVGGQLEFQVKGFVERDLVDIDPTREHKLLVAAGYEYLETTEGTRPGPENRITLGVTPQARPIGGLLLSDRNRVEFRWVDGAYSSRYRNRVGVDYVTKVSSVRLTPYAQAEFFYDITKDAWNEERYTLGIEWPYRRILKLATYYTRQACDGCSPEGVNILGITLHYFLRNDR